MTERYMCPEVDHPEAVAARQGDDASAQALY